MQIHSGFYLFSAYVRLVALYGVSLLMYSSKNQSNFHICRFYLPAINASGENADIFSYIP